MCFDSGIRLRQAQISASHWKPMYYRCAPGGKGLSMDSNRCQSPRCLIHHPQEWRSQGITHEGFFHRRQLQEPSHKIGQESMGYARRVAEHLVLQSPSFKILKNHPFEGSFPVENPLLAFYELERSSRAFESACPAVSLTASLTLPSFQAYDLWL